MSGGFERVVGHVQHSVLGCPASRVGSSDHRQQRDSLLPSRALQPSQPGAQPTTRYVGHADQPHGAAQPHGCYALSPVVQILHFAHCNKR